MIAASAEKGTAISHICRSCSLSQREDVPVPILVPVFSIQPEQSTSLSDQPPGEVRSGVPVKTQRFLVLLSISYPIFFFLFGTSERNLITPGKTRAGGRSNRVPVFNLVRNICQKPERRMVSTLCSCSLSRSWIKKRWCLLLKNFRPGAMPTSNSIYFLFCSIDKPIYFM